MSYSSFLILLEKNPHIQFVDFLLTDLNGVFRGKRYPVKLVESVIHKGMRLPFSTVGVDIWGQDVLDNGLVYETGDSDGICRPVAPVRIPFHHPDDKKPGRGQNVAEGSVIAEVLMSMMREDGETPFLADPRQLLNHILQWFHARKLQPVMATELEFYLFNKEDIGAMEEAISSDVPVHSSQVYSIAELDKFGPFLDALYGVCERQQIPVESAISESGIGQFEVNLQHSNNILQMADQTISFKHIVKQVAEEFNLTASFMAKPKSNDSGSGMHVHVSLTDEKGNNIFDDQRDDGEQNLQHAIGGCLNLLADSMLIYAPHHNSYRRFGFQTHAPTTATWGYDNRTSAIRVPDKSGPAARLEHRVAGADANPYLVMTGILTAMAYGLENKIKPPRPVEGNAYHQQEDGIEFPTVWHEAIEQFSQSKVLKHYLGELFVNVFTQCKLQEHKVLGQYISPFELQTYLSKV